VLLRFHQKTLQEETFFSFHAVTRSLLQAQNTKYLYAFACMQNNLLQWLEKYLLPSGFHLFLLIEKYIIEDNLVIEVVSVANGLSAANARTGGNPRRRMVLQSSAIHDGGWC
jgi:hypothetical protein